MSSFLPQISPTVMMGIFAGLFVLSIPLYSQFLRKKLQKETRFKVWCLFHTPAGGKSFELCPVRGVYVFRNTRKGEEPKSIKGGDANRLGRDVYTLAIPNYKTMQVIASGNGSSAMEDTEEDEFIGAGMATQAKLKKGKISVAEQKAITRAVRVNLKNRSQVMYPLNGGGMFSPQMPVPFAEFIEGYSPEVDPVSVALGQFTADPIFQSDLVGNILDEKLTSLAAWFSNYIEQLQRQLAKMLNPNVQLIVFGVMALLMLVCVALVWTMRGQVTGITTQLSVIRAALEAAGLITIAPVVP